MALPNDGGVLAPRDLGMGRLFESIRDAVIVADANTGRMVLWNPAAEEIFGYSSADALGMSVEELVPDYLRARHRAGMAGYRDTGHGPFIDSNTVLDLPAVRKTGEEIRVELTLSPIEPVRGAAVEGRFVLAIVRDATERKRAEEEVRRLNGELEERVKERTTRLRSALAELRKSEERSRLLVEGAEDYAIFMLTPDGRVASWNKGAERIFGHEEGEIVGKDGAVLFTPEDVRRGAPEAELRRAEAEGRAKDERWHSRKNGTRFWASGFVRPLRDEEGNLRGFSKVARDITERKKAEERERFLSDLDRSLQPLTDPDEVTAAAARTLGEHLGADRCAYAEVESDEDHFLITGDYARGVPSIVGRFAMSQFGSEALRLSRENEPYVVHDAEQDERVVGVDLAAYRQTQIRAVVSVPLHKGGRFVAGMAVHQKEPRRWSDDEVELVKAVVNRCWESMERARAVRESRRSEERYRAVIEQSVEGIYLLDTGSKRILETNPSLQGMLGYSAEELEGMPIYDLVDHPREDVDAKMGRTLQEERLLIAERRYRRKDGTVVHVEIAASAISFEGHRAICAAVRDITERKRAEEAMREVREAERARMARDLHDGVLQDLSYTAASMTLMMIEAEGTSLEKQLQGTIDAVRRAAQELRYAVNDLRLENEEDRPLPIILEHLVQRNRVMARGQALGLHVEEGFSSEPLGKVGVEVLRIVQEALTNARRHSGASSIRVSLRTEENHLVVEVTDDGRGFAPGATPGVGSMSMSERAMGIGGEVEIESAVGQGTKVRLRVPVPQKR